jgi:hypothetical protein
VGNQNTSSIKEIASPRLSKIDQQIPFNVETHTGWPEPTTPKKSDFVEIRSSQGWYDLKRNACGRMGGVGRPF